MRSLIVTFAFFVAAAGCASPPTVKPLDADHPASPLAGNAMMRSPSAILDARNAAPPSNDADVPGGKSDLYTCPMHPKVQQAEPGRCPECGMTLVKPSEHHHDGGER